MKIITYILALTILGLSVYPCSDGLDCDEEQEATSHNHSEDEEDNCSVYCLCACCGSSFVGSKIKASELINKQALFTFNFHYSFHYSFSYQSTVWHPPTYC
jgi:hypothetical protein